MPDKIKCNACGNEINKSIIEFEGFGMLNICFGSDSRFDGQIYEANLCDDCSKKLIKDFKLMKTHDEFCGG